MNYEDALKILTLKSDYSDNELRHAYYRHSLKFHPDKNNSEEATEKFRDGKKAYEFLLKHKNIPMTDEDDDISYVTFFKKCMKFMIPELEDDDKFINNTLKTLVDSCKNVTLKMIEKMNKDRAFQIYNYLIKYQDLFNIDDKLKEEILEIINTKTSSDNIIILNPCLNDLINDKIYKFSTEGREYYVPLWHTEITYDVSGNDLILQCIPELPNNIFIDNYNNLHVTIESDIQKILDSEELEFDIGNTAFKIPGRELKIKKKQTYILRKKGILLAQYNDLYDTTKRGDIYIYLAL